jgi:hypothetical protein
MDDRAEGHFQKRAVDPWSLFLPQAEENNTPQLMDAVRQ